MKVKDASGAVSAPVAVDLYYFPSAVYDGQVFTYDAAGNPLAYSCFGSLAGFIYGGEDYYYRKNLEGDITGIYDDAGNLKVTYTYDMWGKLTGVTDTSGTGLADVNPFRYRGYYYDSETGYYYLNSRYYDPETGRFLNADDPAYIGDSGIGGNLYAYCGNNAVNDSDPGGNISAQQLWDIISSFLAYACTNLALFGVKKATVCSRVLSWATIILAVAQLLYDLWKKPSKVVKRRYLLAFSICIISNGINIFLSYVQLSVIKSHIKQFIWFLASCLSFAVTVSYWLLSLCMLDGLTYKRAKREVKKHKC